MDKYPLTATNTIATNPLQDAEDKIAELEEKVDALQFSRNEAGTSKLKANAIREMLVAMKEVSSGVGYGIVIHISDIEEYVNNLEKE